MKSWGAICEKIKILYKKWVFPFVKPIFCKGIFYMTEITLLVRVTRPKAGPHNIMLLTLFRIGPHTKETPNLMPNSNTIVN